MFWIYLGRGTIPGDDVVRQRSPLRKIKVIKRCPRIIEEMCKGKLSPVWPISPASASSTSAWIPRWTLPWPQEYCQINSKFDVKEKYPVFTKSLNLNWTLYFICSPSCFSPYPNGNVWKMCNLEWLSDIALFSWNLTYVWKVEVKCECKRMFLKNRLRTPPDQTTVN